MYSLVYDCHPYWVMNNRCPIWVHNPFWYGKMILNYLRWCILLCALHLIKIPLIHQCIGFEPCWWQPFLEASFVQTTESSWTCLLERCWWFADGWMFFLSTTRIFLSPAAHTNCGLHCRPSVRTSYNYSSIICRILIKILHIVLVDERYLLFRILFYFSLLNRVIGHYLTRKCCYVVRLLQCQLSDSF